MSESLRGTILIVGAAVFWGASATLFWAVVNLPWVLAGQVASSQARLSLIGSQ